MTIPKLTQGGAKVLLGAAWLVALAIGIGYLEAYEHAAGSPGAPVSGWPADAAIARASDRCTLVLVLHPRCGCSRATLAELAQVMAHAQGEVAAQVLFVRPAGCAPEWEKTDLWKSAEAIPGVTPLIDADGAEARRFHAETSGTALLFAPSGKLLFRGGITASRGHEGENAGALSIAALLSHGRPLAEQTPVYGCSLF